VRELRGEAAPPPSTAVEMHLGLDLRLPERYIGEETLRLAVYRRIAAVRNEDELSALRQEFTDRFGPAPEQLDHLLLHQRLRRRAEMLGVVRIRRTPSAFELVFDPNHPRAHPTVMALLQAVPGAGLTPAQVLRLPTVAREPAQVARALAELLPRAE
jgi:transcription-repair coupling factor (superfamily II helicase)